MRTIDLFRRADTNSADSGPAIVGAGGRGLFGGVQSEEALADANSIDADELAGVIRKTELKVSRAQCAAVVAHLDNDGSGALTVDEIEEALRDARRRQRNIPTDAATRARNELGGAHLRAFLPRLHQQRHAQHRRKPRPSTRA